MAQHAVMLATSPNVGEEEEEAITARLRRGGRRPARPATCLVPHPSQLGHCPMPNGRKEAGTPVDMFGIESFSVAPPPDAGGEEGGRHARRRVWRHVHLRRATA